MEKDRLGKVIARHKGTAIVAIQKARIDPSKYGVSGLAIVGVRPSRPPRLNISLAINMPILPSQQLGVLQQDGNGSGSVDVAAIAAGLSELAAVGGASSGIAAGLNNLLSLLVAGGSNKEVARGSNKEVSDPTSNSGEGTNDPLQKGRGQATPDEDELPEEELLVRYCIRKLHIFICLLAVVCPSFA